MQAGNIGGDYGELGLESREMGRRYSGYLYTVTRLAYMGRSPRTSGILPAAGWRLEVVPLVSHIALEHALMQETRVLQNESTQLRTDRSKYAQGRT